MCRLKLIVLILAALFGWAGQTVPVVAQTDFVPMPSIGVKVGANSSTAEVSPTESTSRRWGFAGGAYAGVPLGFLTLQFEAMYDQKGFTKSSYQGVTGWEIKYSYLDFPVLLRLDVPLDGIVHPFFYAGGSMGILLDAEERSSETSGEWIDANSRVENLNWCLLFGLGLEIGNFVLDARFYHGLTNLNKATGILSDVTVEDRTFSFLVGYIIAR